jgi:hypothetical protein
MSGAEVAESQPKKVGRVVRPESMKVVVLRGIGGNEYADGKRVVRFFVAIMLLPSAHSLPFPVYTEHSMS